MGKTAFQDFIIQIAGLISTNMHYSQAYYSKIDKH